MTINTAKPRHRRGNPLDGAGNGENPSASVGNHKPSIN